MILSPIPEAEREVNVLRTFQSNSPDAFEKVFGQTHHFLLASLLIGFSSMAVIQMLKDTLPVRRWFQRNWLRQWLSAKGQSPHFLHDDQAERTLIQLATDGDSTSFYNLPIEQLCGRMNAASQAALDHPQMYPVLLKFLASNADEKDLARILNGPPPEARKPRSELIGNDRALSAVDGYVDARNRVAHQIQRAIDSLQVSAGQRWKLWIQILSIAISLIIAWLGVGFFGEISGWQRAETITAVALLGGFFAPIARDLIAGLQQLRN